MENNFPSILSVSVYSVNGEIEMQLFFAGKTLSSPTVKSEVINYWKKAAMLSVSSSQNGKYAGLWSQWELKALLVW